MRHLIFTEAEYYPIAILIKANSFNKDCIDKSYITPLYWLGVQRDSSIAVTLNYDENGKTPAKFIKEYLDTLLEQLNDLRVTHLYVTDSSYFKTLTKSSKAEPHLGYALPCKMKGYEHMKVVLGVNYQALIYNPLAQHKLKRTLEALSASVQGTYVATGTGIIHSSSFPTELDEIAASLETLHQYKELTADIEAFSLRFNEAGVASIAFAWDKNNGVAFACDYQETGTFPVFGQQQCNLSIRKLIKRFLTEYKGKITWHNATYDIKVLIYSLWMEHPLDTAGLLTGLEVLTRSFDDTKIIAYLATNSTAGNVLGLKALAHEYAGNWAQEDIKDVGRIPRADLLKYNLVDCLATWFVKEKYLPVMLADKQEDIYNNIMLPSLKTIIQMELVGMPMKESTVLSVKAELQSQEQKYRDVLTNSPIIKTLNVLLQTSAMEAANAKLKVKQHPLEKFSDVVFNPNSGLQLQRLLYEQIGLPVLDLTDTKQPATGGDTIKKLINHTNEPAYKELLEALIAYSGVSKILSTFIPAFERGMTKADGRKYLHGSFNLGGTVSGRLSSSDPNLQNLPAKSEFGELIKTCFSAPGPSIRLNINELDNIINSIQ